MSKTNNAGSYQFGFLHQGVMGLVTVGAGNAQIWLDDGKSPVWTADTVPAPVALSILKARIAAARERVKGAYPYGVPKPELVVSRETPQPAVRTFVQVAEGFDPARLAIAPETPARGTEHVLTSRRTLVNRVADRLFGDVEINVPSLRIGA